MNAKVLASGALLALTAAAPAQPDAERAAFRAIYEELLEIDSSPTTGSCTKVVRAAESRLRAAGFAGDTVQVVIPDGRPEDGNLVARIKATNPTRKAVLLLAHIDVVDAKRQQLVWEGVAEGRVSEEELQNPKVAINAVVTELMPQYPGPPNM